MKDLKLVPYDIFGYLAPGFVLLILLGLLPEFNAEMHHHFYGDSNYPSFFSKSTSKQGQASTETKLTVNDLNKIKTIIENKMEQTNDAEAILALQQALEINKNMTVKSTPAHPKNEHFLLKKDMDVSFYLLWIGIAYILGHIIASLSIWLVEYNIVKRFLGTPAVNFFVPRKFIFLGGYGSALPEPVRTRLINYLQADMKISKATNSNDTDGPKTLSEILHTYWNKLNDPNLEAYKKKNEKKKLAELGKAIYYHAYTYLSKNEAAHTLHERFINLYGFSRNVATSLLAIFIIYSFYPSMRILLFLIKKSYYEEQTFYTFLLTSINNSAIFIILTILCFILAFILFNCYLKFYQLCYREAFLSYYYAKITTSTSIHNDEIGAKDDKKMTKLKKRNKTYFIQFREVP